jgi:hypothetical protein
MSGSLKELSDCRAPSMAHDKQIPASLAAACEVDIAPAVSRSWRDSPGPITQQTKVVPNSTIPPDT